MLCVAAAVAATGLWAQKLSVDKVVAQVGNSVILYSEVKQAAADMEAYNKELGVTPKRDLFYEALEGLMERKLAYNQAQIDSLTIDQTASDTEAGEILSAQIKEAGGVKELEAQHNMTIYDIRKTLEQQMREAYYAQTMQSAIIGAGKVAVTPGEVELFFETFPSDSIPTIPEQYIYAQITRFPSNMKEAKERVREQLMGFRERIVAGDARFQTLARIHSEDRETGNKGGELPPLTLEQMDPEWQTVVERLRPGQISEVVESEYGLQIIELVEHNDGLYTLRYIPMKPKYTPEDLARGALFLDSLARVIRADSITFEAAARRYSNDASSRQNGGVVTNAEYLQIARRGSQISGSDMMFKFRKDDFNYNPRDYIILSGLKPGEVSDSFSARDLKGNEMSKIVKLLQIIPSHEANMADDYLLLEQAALNAKREKAYQEWLNKTIAATHVSVDPAYKDPTKWQNKAWLK
jgi:peptidyl-prolyl cis-trans isomerase SurA